MISVLEYFSNISLSIVSGYRKPTYFPSKSIRYMVAKRSCPSEIVIDVAYGRWSERSQNNFLFISGACDRTPGFLHIECAHWCHVPAGDFKLFSHFSSESLFAYSLMYMWALSGRCVVSRKEVLSCTAHHFLLRDTFVWVISGIS